MSSNGDTFWARYLRGLVPTALPRWRSTAPPAETGGVIEVPLDDSASLAGRLGVPADIPALAVTVRVVALLAGEPAAVIGYRHTPLRVRLPEGSWADLVHATASAVAEVAPQAGVPAGAPRMDVVFDAATRGDAALAVERSSCGSTLRLRHRADLIDAEHARRIGGYLARAMAAMAAGPDEPYAVSDPLSPDEHRRLREFGTGAVRELPDRRFHELFAERARRHPDAVAALHRGLSWSYARLDRRANQIAHALLAAGLSTGDVVGIATERSLDWLAGVIGVLKAGGVYLPLEPSFPAARITTLLDRSGCRIVLTDSSGASALSDVNVAHELPLEATLGAPAHDPGVPVQARQLAYIYFTSGSTGLPKGAMCEHLGLLNHLLAKVDDLGLDPDDVVVQNAQQSFDISLWQLLAPLLSGGRTLIVERDMVLDPARLLDTIAEHGATVLQTVPSYLDVLLRQVGHRPAGLGPVRLVSVTGEAVSKALVNRWFAACPTVPLVNAYGATEASDDTTHELLVAPPDGDLVPVGRPVANVTVYVLGPDGALLPPGCVGEIAFAGISVGRGYVNDPERTAEAFGTDPWQPGARLYRTGDFGRWLPSGTLEFHGRRDDQVKIHGVRIELGEVHSRLLQHPRVGEAAVVTVPEADGAKSLAAFYTGLAGAAPVSAEELRAHLSAALPPAAVPARIHHMDTLPLNENGKVDRKALVALAAAPTTRADARGSDDTGPCTPAERRIAEVWAQALDRPVGDISGDDHFFDIGGTSLSALRVVATLNGLVSLDDMLRAPTLRALAAVADGGGAPVGGLLRLLAGEPRSASGALVCLPYAAGTALDFRPLAAEIAERDPTIAVYAVQPPGHDLSRPSESPWDVVRLAGAVAAEILEFPAAPVVLWGHCTGAVTALESARQLEQAGAPPAHVVLAALLREPDDELARQNAAVTATGDEKLAGRLAGSGLTVLTERDRAWIGRVYRHDTRAANEYLAGAEAVWDGQRLAADVTVAVATDDPLTPGYGDRFAAWTRFAARVRLFEVGGGHYFARTRADRCAEELIRLVRSVPAATVSGSAG